MPKTIEAGPTDVKRAYHTLAELMVWIFADADSSGEQRWLVAGNYVIASAMLPAEDWAAREKNFTDGLVAAGAASDKAEVLRDFLFEEHTYRGIFKLSHIPTDQRGFGVTRQGNQAGQGIDLDEGAFVASVLETFTQ